MIMTGNRTLLTCLLLGMVISLVASRGYAQGVGRCGPAENPDRYPDYGGTPDVTLSTDLGLSVGEVEQILKRATAPDHGVRIAAALELKKSAAGSEEVLREVLWSSHGARNAQIREVVRLARSRVTETEGEREGGMLGVLLEMDPIDPERGPGTRAAVRIVSMLVALWNLDTMSGYKVILDFSGRHAGIFRKEIGRMMVRRGFDGLPALIYGRGSSNQELHMFAVKWIRDMGNPLLGEQIRGIGNPRRLAQLLEAYASVNELDAVDVTLSMAAHDSVFVRRSARACLTDYGKNAKWAIRRTYENTFAQEPPDGGSVDSWLARLYQHWDSERIADELQAFNLGLEHRKKGELEEMEALFSMVLRNEPMFDRRHEMAAGFLERAAVLEEDERLQEARAATLLAARVARTNTEEARLAKARLDWLEAEANRVGGALDQDFYRQVLQEDPEHKGASRWAFAFAQQGWNLRQDGFKVVVVSLLVFFSLFLVYLRLRKSRPDTGGEE